MRLNGPKAKICFKLDSNRLLIAFFDPIPAVRFNRRNNSIQIRTQCLNLIKYGQKRPDFVVFFIIFEIICRFQYNSSFSIK